MQLPTQGQVLAATRNIAAGVGVAIGLFGLAGKVDMNDITNAIKAGGDLVASAITFVGLATPLVMAAIAAWKSSRTQQVKSVAAVPGTTVVLPAPEAPLARSVPGPSVVSATQVDVVTK